MSDERQEQETVAGIVAEMRECADSAEKHDLYDLRECATDYLRVLADRIEAANSRFYDKYKEHTDELNRQILVLKREKEMSDTYFCGYDPEEALVAQCSTCRFFQKKYSHCKLHDSLTNAKYKCSGLKFKTNKECADEYNASRNHEVAELRAENARLRAALKVAEDALGESKVAVCHTCDSKCYCGYEGAKFDPCCVYKDIDKALALIREEGDTK